MAGPSLIDRLPPIGSDPSDVLDGFAAWAAESGRPLYPHQEEAALALADDQHVVLATPTGSGKSMAALAGIVLALNRGERAVWTAPIKALVSEKFFELVDLLGAQSVGLAIGDASINREAPILVCTAEVLANQALGGSDNVGFACLDEFHYYGEHDRGWAWQIPLLLMPKCQFLLASATLGDVTPIVTDLERRSGRPVTLVTSVNRPTPLYHQYRITPVSDSVLEAIEKGLSPIYLVHSSQADAIERAQAMVSLPLTTRPQREAIAEAIKGVKLNTGFGQALGRYLRNGVGVHHAGMLPKYRRLVEKLAADGLLPVICGTDTLGVGINIPIRTVLMSALTKFDGTKVRTLRAREFHQLAGRAGRPGFDPDGHVWSQAPEHVIDNERALARAGDDPKARRKVKRSDAPKGFVHWDEKTFERLINSSPEPLVSRFKVTADLVASVLSRPIDGPDVLKDLLFTNHDTETRKRTHKRRAIHVYRSLEAAGVASRVRNADGSCAGVRIGSEAADGTDDLERVRFTSPLGPFAIEAIASFEKDLILYPLDVVSVIECTVENPMAILIAQEKQARAAEINRLKSEGVEFDERILLIEGVSWPKPLEEELNTMFAIYKQHHPWTETYPQPKSIVRELIETGEGFSSFIKRFGLERSEGLLLRYLTDVWRALDRSLALDAYTDEVEDVIDWLAAMIKAVDASLIEEWELLAGFDPGNRPSHDAPSGSPLAAPAGPPKGWKTVLRTQSFSWVELLAIKRNDKLVDRTGWTHEAIYEAMKPYWEAYDSIGTDGDARSSAHFSLAETVDEWTVTQTLVDPAEDCEWRFTATVNIAESMEAGHPILRMISLAPL
jgi:superfamily II RNA helicase